MAKGTIKPREAISEGISDFNARAQAKNYWQGFYDAAYILCLEGFVNEAKDLVVNCYVPRILLKKVLENAVFNKLDEYIFSCKEYVETETEKSANWFANNKYWKDMLCTKKQ